MNISDVHPVEPDSPDLLPSSDDIIEMRNLFEIHIARILTAHIPFMKAAFSDVVDDHIFHEFYEEMGTKPDVVSLVRTLYCMERYIIHCAHESRYHWVCFSRVKQSTKISLIL